MGKIRVLSDRLANQIAAGEVVERPASVVKELFENALDAQASRIVIRLGAGGKQLIEVEDNGCGMDREDCLMALERHATSKLSRTEDLFTIRTLGFRGEALPSIASVSFFELSSRSQEAPHGVCVRMEGGRLQGVEEVARMPGTTVSVKRLFFNVPARRKFLRQTDTELSHIVQIATNYAFAFPELALQLWHNDRKLIQLDPVKHLQERVYQHFGKDFLDHLLPLEANHNDWRLHGAVSHPRFRRPSRQFQYLFVNQRLVRDKVLTHAVVEAYREFGFATGDHPAVFLFLDVPGDELDVNVHPAKTEIRFIQSGYIHDFVRDALKACLLRKPHTVASSSGSDPLRETAGNGSASPSDAGDPLGSSPGGLPRFLPPSYPVRERFDPYRALVAPAASGEPSRTNPVEHLPDTAQEAQVLPSMEWTQTPTCLGQFRASFLLAESQDTLLIIDQHVAHERLLYDRLRKAYEQQAVERQVFAVPIPLELTLAEAHVSQTWLPLLDAFGFELTPFDGGSFVIRSGPAFLPFSQVEASVHDLLALARGKSRETAVEAFLDHLCASRACKAAVKINMPLNLTQGQDLIDQLWRSQSPLVCPHGRPIVIELSWLELEKRFKRR